MIARERADDGESDAMSGSWREWVLGWVTTTGYRTGENPAR